jgi:hypothetical protein
MAPISPAMGMKSGGIPSRRVVRLSRYRVAENELSEKLTT